MSLGTPMASQASLFTGMVAAEDWVAKAVIAGGKMCFTMVEIPSFPDVYKRQSISIPSTASMAPRRSRPCGIWARSLPPAWWERKRQLLRFWRGKSDFGRLE